MNNIINNKFTKNLSNYWQSNNKYIFNRNKPKIKLHEATFDEKEVIEIFKTLLTTKVTMGKKVLNFENNLSKYFSVSNSVTNNSGSSANLLAISGLCNPTTKKNLKPGDEVIVPALSWSTTVWPLIQNNLTPVFVDCELGTLNIDENKIEKAITKKTKAIMIVHVYGNPCNLDKILKICKKYDLQLIEDSCESLGAFYKNKAVGTFGRVGTFSFYYSHHITTLEGGVCVTNDSALSENLRVLRAHGWTRELKNKPKLPNKLKKIDQKFLFVNLGYNLRLTEIQGAMGILQLKKLDYFVKLRRKSSKYLIKHLSKYNSFIRFQKETKNSYHSWFGFCILIKTPNLFNANQIRKYLEKKGIETRPIIAGNMTKHPALKYYKYKISDRLTNCDYVMENGFAIPCHQSLDAESLKYMVSIFEKFFSRLGIDGN